ncbi:hypothetical protein [Vibrio breoganii]|uniref:hypothetical protein n=1 Tax=Vibrio breoganii TaxID=553239 RepID=UPI0012FFFD94|nr:hypothetical protein [Vibrio breoganii]
MALLLILSLTLTFGMTTSEAKPNNNSDKIDIAAYCAKNPNDQSTKCNKIRRN